MTLWPELVNYFQGTSPIFSPGYRANIKLSKKFSPELMLKSFENHILDWSVEWLVLGNKISFDWSLADQISQLQRIFLSKLMNCQEF